MPTLTAVEIEPWKVSGQQLFRSSCIDPTAGLWGDHFPAISEWLERLGIPAKDVNAFAVFHSREGRLQLVVNELCTDPNGWRYLNFAADRVADRYRTFDIGTEPSWPECLNDKPYATPGLYY